MYKSHPPSAEDYKVLSKIYTLYGSEDSTIKFGTGFRASDAPTFYYTLEEFFSVVDKVYISCEDAGNTDRPSGILQFDSSDYTVDRIMFTTMLGYTVYMEGWNYYYGRDECGKSEVYTFVTYEDSPNELLTMDKTVHLGLTLVN